MATQTRNLSGWRRQAYDPRDWYYRPTRRTLRTLNPTYDLSKNMGVQLNQDQLGSCGPNTVDELVQFDQKVQGLNITGASRLFVYWTTRYLMGTIGQDSGVDNRTMMQALAKYGFPDESIYPYNEGQYNAQPPNSVFQASLTNAIKDYAAVTQDLQHMKGAISDGIPFMFGFDVFNGIMSDATSVTGIVPDPAGSVIGGHDVSFCGYSDVDQPGVQPGKKWPGGSFKFRNHWLNNDGTPWGDGGYGYISYAYATGGHASDFWSINTVPGGVIPPPTPVPTPPIPPAPTPTPTPGGLSLILQVVDGVFLQFERRIPVFAPLFRAMNADIDMELAKLFGQQLPRAFDFGKLWQAIEAVGPNALAIIQIIQGFAA